MTETVKTPHEHQTRRKEDHSQEQQQQGNGMVSMAKKVEWHHVKPAPEAVSPAPEPFPTILWHGLGWGTAVGLALGALVAWLLLSGTLVITGWEGLFSMVPATFYAFWMMIGAALGVVLGGVGTIFAAKAPSMPHHRNGSHA